MSSPSNSRDSGSRHKHRKDRSRSPHKKHRRESPDDHRHRKRKDDHREKRKEEKVKSEPDFGAIVKVESNNPVPAEKEAPNFEVSGKLLEDTNVFNGVVIKYSEPQEARKPKRRWRFYVFKGDESLPTLHLHRQSAFLIGKDRKVVDLPVDHPSCSRQHAVLQYRLVPRENIGGSKSGVVLPYIIDLGSSNGTFLNNQKIEPRRYVELKEKDVLKFGFSSREYVLLHDQSQGADSD